ncbi:pilus assembly protein TadB [Saccharopolyspora elongata]|uniref:Pilus assembly protein TadB n=1 Tax=Saccharopolyspora elongata TaxID=2530387 RepID=A0A4R4YBF5_9PSEU|nr:pilus assembly protein TadB [Saccharopolyspora elongata]TDD41380.1 pilus assembly protein TadB [Saccharopolyspora elongata]
MNTALTLAAGLGIVLGTGLTLGLRAIAGPAPMDVSAALDHLATRTTASTPATGWRAWRARLVTYATDRADHARHPWLGIPTHDLGLLERTTADYMTTRLRWAVSSLAAATLLAVSLAVAGVPVGVSVGLVAAGGLVGAVVPVSRLRDQAAVAREDAKRALAVYLDLVAQQRTAGHAPGPALREAAAVGDHWLLTRLHRTLTHAEHSGHSPWDALRALGTTIRLPELAAVADLAATAADGAAIYTSLTTHAASLRTAAISTDKADANTRTERLTLPVTLLMLGILLLVLYPAVTRLLG